MTYTAAFKAKVALAAAKQDKTLSQLAAQFKVHPLVISKWQSQLLNNTEAIFQDGHIKKTDDNNIQELYHKHECCESGASKVSLFVAGSGAK